MDASGRNHRTAAAAVIATFALTGLLGSGCVTAPRMDVCARRYRIEVHMAPESHFLAGRAVLDLERVEATEPPADRPAAVELLLHPDLRVARVLAAGAKVRGTTRRPPIPDEDSDFAPARLFVVLDRPADALTLFVEYSGVLYQDVSASEIPGEIHNFEMRAHVGQEGIYLADGFWFPRPASDKEAPALADYTLLAQPVEGLELVAGAEQDPLMSEQTGMLAWRTPYPVDGMVLVGGPHEIHHTEHRDVSVNVHLKPGQAHHADGLLKTVKRNFDRYEPLIGRYPGSEYAIVDNFFSSGFAFPTFTLLSSAVINMGERAQTGHGYIDHEMLHSWWGNGIHVDPSDGNWCEALASYAANYYGHVLDGKEDEARRKRRNYSHFLSRLDPEEDKPLDTYGLPDGCGRGIAYHKGAAVFHMLARKIGQENFWAAMRRFTDEYVGRYASWDDIRSLCERESGQSLETFFGQWVRRSGAPQLRIEGARYDSDGRTLSITVSQGEPPFELELPVRIMHAEGSQDVIVSITKPTEEIDLPIDLKPFSVELDPDYHVFRKVSLDEIVPTTASTRNGTAFASVLPAASVAERYEKVASRFAESFEEDQCVSYKAGELAEGALAERCALILGEAVRDTYVAGFLSAIQFPVRWHDDGFELSGVRYSDPKDAVLCTVRHPGVTGGGVTVLFANSEEAIPRPMIVPMYDRSVVIFEDGRAVVRLDLEQHNVVRVEHR